jgi:hypothetical protein
MFKILTYVNGKLAHYDLRKDPQCKTVVRLSLGDVVRGFIRRGLVVEVLVVKTESPFEKKDMP